MSRKIIALGLTLFLGSGAVCAGLSPVSASVGPAEECAAGEDRADGKVLLCSSNASFALQGHTLGQSHRQPKSGLSPSVATAPQIPSLTNRTYLLRAAFLEPSVGKVSLNLLHTILTL